MTKCNSFDWKNRALIVVDPQYDFIDGSLAVWGAKDILKPINDYARMFKSNGGTIVVSQDWHPTNHCSFIENGGEWPVHCVQGTHGAELHQDILPTVAMADVVIQKGTDVNNDSYSAFADNRGFTSTGLDKFLKARDIREVEVVGLALDYCVKFTAIDAVKFGFASSINFDLTKMVTVPKHFGPFIKELENSGVELTFRWNQE